MCIVNYLFEKFLKKLDLIIFSNVELKLDYEILLESGLLIIMKNNSIISCNNNLING